VLTPGAQDAPHAKEQRRGSKGSLIQMVRSGRRTSLTCGDESLHGNGSGRRGRLCRGASASARGGQGSGESIRGGDDDWCAGISSLRSLLLMAFHPTHLPSISSRAQSIGGAQIRLARPSDAASPGPIKRTPSLYIKCSSPRFLRCFVVVGGAWQKEASQKLAPLPLSCPSAACWMFAPRALFCFGL
jgi:hypothetical protein